ncbi:hypothetical protein [Rummeliibacillus stabekisii]|uniref:hypothetical protein n=1 Tax=Rummeliibacillus stabekisii TaxID=241244 RepID=UPI00371C102C
MKKKFMSVLFMLCSFALIFSSFVSVQHASAASTKTDFTKAINSNIKSGAKSYKFDVTYKTNYNFAVYLGNSNKDNEDYANGYTVKIYNAKNKEVAKSKRSSFNYYGKYFIYQTIDTQLSKGKYTLKISVNKDTTLEQAQRYFIYTDREVHGGDVTVSSITTKTKSPHRAKKSIALSTKAKGSYLQYQYSVINSKTKAETTLCKYKSQKTATWKPTKPGNYKIKVVVKNIKSGKSAKKTISLKVIK